MSDSTSLVFDPSTGRPILVALGRSKRPILTSPDQGSDSCPFCPGEEHQTPAELDAVRAEGSSADQPGWSIRAFDNLYPAAQYHEVIVEGAEHSIHPGDLDAGIWQDALQVYRRRISAIEAHENVRCTFLFKNVGRQAGASIAHNHTQLLGLPILPPRLELELEQQDRGYAPQDEITDAEQEGRLVHRGDSHVVLCPRHPKLPYETWLLPTDADSDFFDEVDSEDLAETMMQLYRAVDRAFDQPALNLYLHRVPNSDFRWHFELQPRVGFLAGLELGGDMYINAVSAAQAAAKLRGPMPT